jgi:SAM-dependent methyltransferase
MRFKPVVRADIPHLLSEYINGSDHPDLKVYRRDLTQDHKDVWLWRIEEYCRLGNFYGKRILEVGSGFGWDAVGLALLGSNEVVASDILPSMIDGMSECLETMKISNKPLPVTPLRGDICELELEPASFDGIFSSEAIEHVHDLGRMFENCYRLLKAGGKAVIVNDSNRFNAAACAHSWEGWADRDESWEHAEWLQREVRPVEHAGVRPYAVMREEMIRTAAPELDDGSVGMLRRATAGMIRTEIASAVDRFKRDGSLPIRDEFGWCRNPETGEYSERLLDPFELKGMLKSRGFKVELRHLFRKMPLRLLNGVQFRPLNMQLFALRPQFALVATKQ